MIDDNHPDFFEILGYLAASKRLSKIDIETHPDSQNSVETTYSRLSGENLIKDGVNYYVWDQDTNKWGAELRVYFRSDNDIPTTISSMVRSTRFAQGDHNARINDNDFIWSLIKYGFRASNVQDGNRIRSRVPISHINEFVKGLNI